MKINKEELNIWQQGYDRGVRDIMKNNEEAIKIGKAIIEAIDKRYYENIIDKQ